MADEKKPTTVEVTTVPNVYLKPEDLARFSAWHHAYVGEPGNPTKLHVLEICGGRVKNLPLATFERFRDAGIVTTERPRRPHEDD